MEAASATSSLSARPPGLTDLKALVGSPATSEADLQQFFTENPHFLLGLNETSCEVRPHVVLTSPVGTKLVPDFMVRLEDQGRVALIELKKPGAHIRAGNREGRNVGRVAAQAIKQLMEYTDAVSTRSARADLIKSIGAAPFDPCLVVLIGRGSPNQRSGLEGYAGRIARCPARDI
ncbi:Shedu anti-phage system protein SduA domain-containing protein [Sinorhizobium meliloti]